MDYAWLRMTVLALAATTGSVAYAEYGEECRALSAQLARDPGSLKVGDLDVLKTCMSDLQRILIVGGTAPEGAADLCPSPVVEAKCPVCPSAAQLCGKRDAAPAEQAPPSRERREPPKAPPPNPLKPALPVF